MLDKNQLVVAASGGIEVICACMTRHCTERPVVSQGCTALWFLALQGTTVTLIVMIIHCHKEKNKPKMIPGAVNALLMALRSLPSVANVCEQACGALKAIATVGMPIPVIDRCYF